jgi:hypothetical protein
VAQPGETVVIRTESGTAEAPVAVDALLKRSDGATSTGGIFLAAFQQAEVVPGADADDPTVASFATLASFDIRGTNLGEGDEATLTFTFPPPRPGETPALMYVTPEGKLAPVLGKGGVAPIFDPATNTITVTLDGSTSTPLLSQLTGTVFTVGVAAPPAAPPPAAAPTSSADAGGPAAAPTPVVTAPPATTTVTVSPALALALTAGTTNSTAADAGNGLTRTTTFQAGTDLSFTLTSSQDRQVTAKSGGTEEESADADDGIQGTGAENDPAAWKTLIKTLNRFWPWVNLEQVMPPMPALPPAANPAAVQPVPPAPQGAFLAPLDAALAELAPAGGDHLAVPADDGPAAAPAAGSELSAAWAVPAVLLGLGGAPLLDRDRKRRPWLSVG